VQHLLRHEEAVRHKGRAAGATRHVRNVALGGCNGGRKRGQLRKGLG